MAPTKSEKPSKGWNDKFKTIGQWLKTIGKIALGFFLFLVLKNIFDEDSSLRKNIRGGRESASYVSLKDKKNDNVGGCIFNDCKNGDGIYAWESGNVYKGEFDEDGKQHGKGTFTWANGDKYTGEWKDGDWHGQGTFTWANGEKYVGEFKDGKEHGQGAYTWTNGGTYIGKYKDGKRNGKGTKIWSNGDKYVGEFKDGLPYGIMVKEDFDGDKYIGEMSSINDTLYYHGRGMYTFSSGSSDIGLWIKNELDLTFTKHEVTSYLEEKYPDQFKLELFE